MLLLSVLLSILPIEARVEPSGYLNIDGASVCFRATQKGTTLKPIYNYLEQKNGERPFVIYHPNKTQNEADGLIKGSCNWIQESKTVLRGEFEYEALKEVSISELAPYISFPYAEYSNAGYEVNGKASRPGDEKFFRKDKAKEILFTLLDGKTLTLGMEDVSPIQIVDLAKKSWTDSWVIRLGMIQKAVTLQKGEKVKMSIRLSSASGFNFKPYKNYHIVENGNWIMMPLVKDFAKGSALDFSNQGLHDAPSGKYGWTKAKNGSFYFEAQSDKDVRFCGTNLCKSANFLPHSLADSLIDRFVAMGYNTIRIHHHDDFLNDAENWDRLDYLIARGISKGIYFTTDMFVSRKIAFKDLEIDREGFVQMNQFKSLIPCWEPAFKNWCEFSRMFFEHVNPYTGRAYKDEPALNLVSLINEGKISNCKNIDDPLIQAEWHRFGGEGSFTKKHPRFREFENYLNGKSYRICSEFLRSIGVKALLTNDNHGHYGPTDDKSECSKAFDFLDDHNYVDHPSFLGKSWSLPSKCNNTNTVYEDGPRSLRRDYVKNAVKPWIITEWNYCGPNRNRSQSGLMYGAMAGANDWDGLWRFAYAHGSTNVGDNPNSKPSSFDLATDPVNLASERATVCLFLRRDISGTEAYQINKEDGSFVVTTDRTCGFFCYEGKKTAGPLSATISGCQASIWVSSLDKNAIEDSERMLLVHITDAHGENCTFADDRRNIVLNYGRGCLIEKGRAEVSLSLNNPKEYIVYGLRGNGERAEKLKTSVKNGKLNFTASTDSRFGGRIYYEIVKK